MEDYQEIICGLLNGTNVTSNDLEGHSLVPGLFKCNPSNICAALYKISTVLELVQSLKDSWASYIHVEATTVELSHKNKKSLTIGLPLTSLLRHYW